MTGRRSRCCQNLRAVLKSSCIEAKAAAMQQQIDYVDCVAPSQRTGNRLMMPLASIHTLVFPAGISDPKLSVVYISHCGMLLRSHIHVVFDREVRPCVHRLLLCGGQVLLLALLLLTLELRPSLHVSCRGVGLGSSDSVVLFHTTSLCRACLCPRSRRYTERRSYESADTQSA